MRKRQWVLNGALANTHIMEMMDAAKPSWDVGGLGHSQFFPVQ